MNETTLASFRAKLKKIRYTMVVMRKKYKKDDPNGKVIDIVDDAAPSYNWQLLIELGEQE